MLAQLTAAVINYGSRKIEEAHEAKDYMPSMWRQEAAVMIKPRRSRAVIASEIRAVMKLFKE